MIDRGRLRAAIRKLGDEQIYSMLAEALELLPPVRLEKLVKGYVDVASLRPDPERKGGLLADVKAFDQASRRGAYYEGFDVNSRNCTEQSKGTRAWIAECHRLLDCCVKEAKRSRSAEVCEAFELIFGLLRHIDECHDDVIFFADEGGSWQVGVDWAAVLPAWFRCLSSHAEPGEYARKVVETVDTFDRFHREKHLAAARKSATAAQRKALPEE